MKNNFLMGMKDNTHYLLKQLLIVILIWMGICTILIKGLFGYCENFFRKKDAKIIYDIKPIMAQRDVVLDIEEII